MSGKVHQRTAGEAGIERDISVDHALDFAALPGATWTIQRTDGAEGDARAIRARAANGDDEVADAQPFAHRGRRAAVSQFDAAQADGGQVGARVAPDKLPFGLAAIRQSDGDVV